MKKQTLFSSVWFSVFGIAGIALGGCHTYSNDGSTSCAGYLGCSGTSKAQVGIAPPPPPPMPMDASMDGGEQLHALNLGCGKDPPAMQIPTTPGTPKGYTHYMVMGTGQTLLTPIPSKAGPRTFWVRLPQNYDKNKKYRTVYIGQGCGGYGVANTSTLQLFKEMSGGTEQAIYVALDIPTDKANMDCYDNRDGPSSQEWEAFELFQTFVDANFCVDNDRVYVSGYSTGGWLNNMWGCYFAGDGLHPWNGVPGALSSITSRASNVSDGGADALMSGADAPLATDAASDGGNDDSGEGNSNPDVGKYMPIPGTARKFAPEYHIRAQAGVSGGEPDNNPPCNGPIAAIWIHDKMDGNAYSSNHDVALPRVLKMNGCYAAKPPTAPWHEDVMGVGVCVEYTACPAAYPVVFCTTNMFGHADQHERAVPGFQLFFNELESHMKP